MEVSEAISSRRAYRSLDPAAITQDTVDALGDAAILASTCFNNQPARFVFVTDPDLLQELQGAMTKANAWTQRASMIITVFSHADYDCKSKGREYYFFGAGMETAQLILKATDLGLVAHPILGFDEDVVKTALGIPEEMRVIVLVVVGKKSDTINSLLNEGQVERESHRPARLPREKFMAMNHFNEALVKEPRK